jgi:hypothetical protein
MQAPSTQASTPPSADLETTNPPATSITPVVEVLLVSSSPIELVVPDAPIVPVTESPTGPSSSIPSASPAPQSLQVTKFLQRFLGNH